MRHLRGEKSIVNSLKRHRRDAAAKGLDLVWKRPLKVLPHKQRESYCGPACIRIVGGAFGLDLDELKIGALCGTTVAEGTTADGLIEGAEKLGATVFAAHDGDIADLRYFLRARELPVIVGWYSPDRARYRKHRLDEDYPWSHYSVVYHVSRTHVYLMDPDDGKRHRYSIKRFKYLWWSSDGEKKICMHHAFVVLNFENAMPKEIARAATTPAPKKK